MNIRRMYKYKCQKYQSKCNQIKINGMTGGSGKYAIVTLLMISDDYLPGILVMANSILRFNKPKNIDLICMITPDVSEAAKADIAKYFDKIIPVDYLEVNPRTMPLFNETQKFIYSKTFTKLHALELVEYDKIVLIDADMIVLKDSFFNIFNYQDPAAIIVGCIFTKTDCELYRKYFNDAGQKIEIGERLPVQIFNEQFFSSTVKAGKNPRKYKGVETSICLLKPSINDYTSMIKMLQTNPTSYQGDTTLLNEYYKYRWYYMDPLYLGRWQDPEKNSQLIVLDLYGSEGKPWHTDLYPIIKNYPDVNYWYKIYLRFYDETFRENCKHPSLKKLYDFLIKQKS